MPDQLTVLADSAGLDFRFRVGTSMLIEFALSHTPADVLRELVQNEYDAGGSELLIDFGQDALVVRGNGKPIDNAGWTRLSVMLGHGLVAGAGGTSERVRPKVIGVAFPVFSSPNVIDLDDGSVR